ncbi:hypothetical protein QYM36_008895 [Artemia franciscana]|uniref:Craniofacial development protein 2-like n=1 Tax=Artemia franciscana TaxID=6661 RepID=A0AA88HMF1_ARTSF|nr:hypothetical protein QYM36_008895 [Artemia franciscana]
MFVCMTIGIAKLPSRHNIIFSAPESRREPGAALIVTKKKQSIPFKVAAKSSRILTTRFFRQHAKLSVMVCYAPTNEASDDVKGEFYKTLHSVASDIPRHDIACFVGNFNAKIGNDCKYCPQTMGCHGLGNRKENGELLVDFALPNDLAICGSCSNTVISTNIPGPLQMASREIRPYIHKEELI